MSSKKENVEALKKLIEESVSRKICTPNDFTFLADEIAKRCKETLGITTLKRIWGYVDGYETTRFSTLSILARSVGFLDWDDFVNHNQKSNSSSNFIVSRSLLAEDIPNGGGVKISWAPDRRCIFKHLGSGSFEVITSENSKLCVGDVFHCSCFIMGKPLYIDHLVRNNKSPKLFVLGNKGGLTSIEQCQL